MSLEQTIADNTAAILKLTEVWAALSAAPAKPAAVAEAPAKAPATPKAKPAAVAASAPAPAAAPVASSTEESASPVLDYAPVGAAITAFASVNGRDKTIALLNTLGVASGKLLKPAQYEEALALFAAEEEAVA